MQWRTQGVINGFMPQNCHALYLKGTEQQVQQVPNRYATVLYPKNEILGTPLLTHDFLIRYVYWQDKAAVWPQLSSVAGTILAIPATETSSERVFSVAGLTAEDHRTQLSAESVDNLLFIHGPKL